MFLEWIIQENPENYLKLNLLLVLLAVLIHSHYLKLFKQKRTILSKEEDFVIKSTSRSQLS